MSLHALNCALDMRISDEHQLIDRVTRALHWCRSKLLDTSVLSTKTRAGVHAEDKFGVETALLLGICSRLGHPQIQSLVAEMVEPCAALIRGPLARARLVLAPQLATGFGLGHSFLAAMGSTDPGFEALLHHVLVEGDAVERAVYRSLESEWVKEKFGLAVRFDPRAATSCSSASAAAYGFHRGPTDFYALTHAVMYFTDFGALPLPPPMRRDNVARSIEIGTSIAILSEHWDILAELLLAAACADLPVSASQRLAWATLLSVWDEYGYIPDHPGTRTFDKADQSSYHTMHVMGVLCAVSLLVDRTERGVQSSERAVSAHLEMLVEYLCFSPSLKGLPRRCLRVASTVEGITDEDLARVLLNAAMIWALRNGELRSLCELARAAKQHGTAFDDISTAVLYRARYVAAELAAIDPHGEIKQLVQELHTIA